MTNKTLAEKIIALNIEKSEVSVNELYEVTPDLTILYDWPALSDWFADMVDNEIGIKKLPYPERIIFFLDHLLPVQNQNHVSFHEKTRMWCKLNDIKYYENLGIGHAAVLDYGLVKPSMLVTHFDTHVSTVGAIGALGFGTMKEVLMTIATGKMWIKIPPSIRVNIVGDFEWGVSGRDLLHYIVGKMGPDWANNKIVEFGGPSDVNISIDGRIPICDLANFFGAITAIFVPDTITENFMKKNNIDGYTSIQPDPGATYVENITINLNEITPMLIAPGSISDAVDISNVKGTEATMGIIGTCAAGRLEDLEYAAQILKNKRVQKGFKLYVIPSTNKVFKEAINKGYIGTLVEAGAFISSPTCDFCFGKGVYLGAGEKAVSTQTLNLPGRLGSDKGEIFLASAAVIAATALTGQISDPRELK